MRVCMDIFKHAIGNDETDNTIQIRAKHVFRPMEAAQYLLN